MKAASIVDQLLSATPLKRVIKRRLLSGSLQRAIKGSEFALELLRLVRPYGHEGNWALRQDM
jgi:hypothetical protein